MLNPNETKKDNGTESGAGKKSLSPVAIVAIVAAALLLVGGIATALILLLGGGGEPSVPSDWSGYGSYYCLGDVECELELKEDGSFVLTYKGEGEIGKFSVTDGGIVLRFGREDKPDAQATFEDGVVTLDYGGATLRLLRRVSFTVSFEMNGAEAIDDVKVLNGGTVQKPDDPKRPGFIFVGWYADGEFARPFTFSSDVIFSDTTVFARWIEDTGLPEREISFELGFESEDACEPVPTLGGRLFRAPVPEREGYVFLGWWVSTDNDAQKLSYRVTEETVFTSDTTLFAVWQRAGETKLPPPSLSLDATGLRWDAIADARSYDVTVTDGDGTAVLIRSVSTAGIGIVFADYAPGVYRIRVVANASTGAADSSEAYLTYLNKGLDKVGGFTVSGSSTLVFQGVANAEKYYITVVCGNPEHEHTELDNGSSLTFSFANCPIPRGGIRFTVRAEASGFLPSVSDTFVFERELAPVGGLTYDGESGLVRWDPVEGAEHYTVSVICGDPSHKHSAVNNGDATCFDIRECPARDGGITVSVYPAAEGCASPLPTELAVSKSALPTPHGITVTGNILGWSWVGGADGYEISVDGTVYRTQSNEFTLPASAVGTLTVRLRAVGTLAGDSAWTDEIVCRTEAFASAPVYSDGYLRWEHVIAAEHYEIRVNDGETVTVTGRNYARITLDRAGQNTVKLRFVGGEAESEWMSISVFAYSVVFDSIGGSKAETLYLALGDMAELPEVSRTGYRFVSWYNVPGGAAACGKRIDGTHMRVTSDTVLYAYYVPERYSIKYNYGLGGSGQGLDGTVEYERDYTLEIPVASDITVSFGGWFSAPYGKGTQYTDGAGRSLVPWSVTGGAEVYAFWIDETLSFTPVKVNGREVYSVSAGPRIALVTEVTVPEMHRGLPVAMVDGNAFAECITLRVIDLPSSIEVISSLDPFAGCTSLEEINVYSGESAASPRYGSAGGVLFENTDDGLKLLRMPSGREGRYTVPDGTCEIADGAFSSSSVLSVVICADVTRIGNDAFACSRALRSVSFAVSGSGDERELAVGKRAFADCTALDGIVLPSRLASIELTRYYVGASGALSLSSDHAFRGCTSLRSIGVAGGSDYYSSIDGLIYSDDGSRLLYCPDAREGEIEIAIGTQSIGAGAFVGCYGITSVKIPNTVTYIGEYAFASLSLERVTFLGRGFSSVTVGDRAFFDCCELTDVSFESGSGVAVIGARAFADCSALEEITIPPSVTSIRDGAFENCTSLRSLNFEGGKKPLELGEGVFRSCLKLTTVYIPANVSSIPGIFGGCSALTEVKVDGASPYFTDVDGVVFSKDMSEIVYFPQGRGGEYTIPEGVSSVGAGVFSGNRMLERLVIPNTVSYIGKEAFFETKIGRIEFAGDDCGDELIIAASAFEGAYFEDYDFILPAHTTEIGERAFARIFYRNIILNEGLRTIGDYAFYLPANANGGTVVIPASVVSIGEYSFSGASEDYYVTVAHRFVPVAFAEGESSLTEIGDYAFYKNSRLSSVRLPDSVKTVGNYAFFECTSLSEVQLSASLASIGAYAFAASAYTYQVPITTLTVPAGVSSIGARAFENCQLLTRVTFLGDASSPDLYLGTAYRRSYTSDGVESFSVERGRVFASCTRLKEVDLSPNVTTLGDYCFSSSGDTGFRVNVPDDSRLATIGAYCFYRSRLESFTVPASVRNLPPTEELGQVYDRLGIGAYAFAVSSGRLTSITFLRGSEQYQLTIGYGAFENQSRLETIELPARLAEYRSAGGEVIPPLADGPLVFYGADSLSSISAEDGCAYAVVGGVLYTADMSGLVFCPAAYSGDVTVPASAERIYDYAFMGCRSLGSIGFAVGSGLAYVGDYAFFGCSSLGSVVLPSSVTTLGEGAFGNSSSLESITLSRSLANFDISVLDGCVSLKNVFVEAGNNLLSSENGVLYDRQRTALVLYPVGRTDTEYTVVHGVSSIGERAFRGNASLELVVLPQGLVEIKESAFEGCASLRTVLIPKTVELVGASAFSLAGSLCELTFESGGVSPLVIDHGAFSSSGVTSLLLPARLCSIGGSAFEESALASLAFEPAESYRLEEIGALAFAGTPLVSLTLPSGLVSVGEGAFLGTSELVEVVFGRGLKSIGAEAFADSSVRHVYLPAELETLGASAFSGCTSLVTVSFALGSQLQLIAEGTFYGCKALAEITLPPFVRQIAGDGKNGAFYGCTSLSSVIFTSDDYCTSIGDYAFYGCTSLSSFGIPSAVGTLGKYAFAGCTSLRDAVINRAVVSLGEGLFEGCTALASVELVTGSDRLPVGMFEGCLSLTDITIPASVAEIGADCFRGTSVAAFRVAEENRYFVSVDGILYNSSRTAIVCFPPKFSSTTLFIPKEVVEISANNFRDCTTLREVVFEEGGSVPLSIGDYAFYGCRALRTLVLPERLVSIGAYSFKGCYALTSVTIPKNVTDIGSFAFSECYKLYEVRNESAIENIGQHGSLNYINNNYYVNAKVNIYTPTEGASVLAREGDFLFATVNGAKRLIGYEGYSDKITLPDGEYDVADYLFYHDDTVREIVIPDTANIRGSSTFSGCTSLEVIFVRGEIPARWSERWHCGKLAIGGYTGENITYNFVTGDGTAVSPITSDGLIVLPETTLESHVFMGWYDDPELEGEAIRGSYYSSQRRTLYASFITLDEYVELYLRGRSMEYAYETEYGNTYGVDIRSAGERIYYAVTALAGDTVTIRTPKGMGYHKIWILDEQGNELLSYYSVSSDASYEINYSYTFVKGGRYYIGVGYRDAKRVGDFEVTFVKE